MHPLKFDSDCGKERGSEAIRGGNPVPWLPRNYTRDLWMRLWDDDNKVGASGMRVL